MTQYINNNTIYIVKFGEVSCTCPFPLIGQPWKLNCGILIVPVTQSKYVWSAESAEEKWQEFASWQHFFCNGFVSSALPGCQKTKELEHNGESTMKDILQKNDSVSERKNKIIVSDDHSRQHWDPSDWGLGRGDSDKNSIDMSNRTLSNFELTLKSPKNILTYAESYLIFVTDTTDMSV